MLSSHTLNASTMIMAFYIVDFHNCCYCTFNLVEEDKLIKEDVPRPFCGVTHIKVNMDLFSNCIISCDNSCEYTFDIHKFDGSCASMISWMLRY